MGFQGGSDTLVCSIFRRKRFTIHGSDFLVAAKIKK
jgi:hypothetical protein